MTPEELKTRDQAAVDVMPNGASQTANAGSSSSALTQTNMPRLKLLTKGKVRDIYELPDPEDKDKLLFVATDRISAYDYIMANVRRFRPILTDGSSLTALCTGHSAERSHLDYSLPVLVSQAFTHYPESHPHPFHLRIRSKMPCLGLICMVRVPSQFG